MCRNKRRHGHGQTERGFVAWWFGGSGCSVDWYVIRFMLLKAGGGPRAWCVSAYFGFIHTQAALRSQVMAPKAKTRKCVSVTWEARANSFRGRRPVQKLLSITRIVLQPGCVSCVCVIEWFWWLLVCFRWWVCFIHVSYLFHTCFISVWAQSKGRVFWAAIRYQPPRDIEQWLWLWFWRWLKLWLWLWLWLCLPVSYPCFIPLFHTPVSYPVSYLRFIPNFTATFC
jgi:hypothetical protein